MAYGLWPWPMAHGHGHGYGHDHGHTLHSLNVDLHVPCTFKEICFQRDLLSTRLGHQSRMKLMFWFLFGQFLGLVGPNLAHPPSLWLRMTFLYLPESGSNPVKSNFRPKIAREPSKNRIFAFYRKYKPRMTSGPI